MTLDPMSELREMGRALGGLTWVQGPGGNVSVKTDDGLLLVKASGKLVAEVAEPGGYATANLATAEGALNGDGEAERALFALAPKPSLETYFHALPGRVIAHTHALGVLLYACSTAPFVVDVEAGVTAIPYVRPGRGVALAMRDIQGEPGHERLVILRSHGIVAFAETAARAIALTYAFDAKIRATMGALPAFEPVVEAYMSAAEVAVDGGVARALPSRMPLETSPPRYLFPDAPVCSSLLFVDALRDIESEAGRALAHLRRACVLVDPAGKRVAVARNSIQLRHTCEVLAAHDWLEDALRARGIANYLPDDEPSKIVNMPSEQYRIRLAEGGEKTC